jgi:hypothetical protein
MISIKVSDPRVSQEYRSGARISFAIEDGQLTAAKLLADELREGSISLECKKWKQKRSLDANAYMWVLVDKIAQATRQKPVDIYRQAIKEVPGASTIVCVHNKAKDVLMQQWQAKGLGWQVYDMGEAKNIADCSVLKLYYGSSTYDTSQMSFLIDSICESARELGIETLTPFELEGMKAQWK